MRIEYSMQQLGLLLPTAALTVNGGWPQRCWRAMADRDENMHGPLVKTTDGNARNPGTSADLVTASLFAALREKRLPAPLPPFCATAGGPVRPGSANRG